MSRNPHPEPQRRRRPTPTPVAPIQKKGGFLGAIWRFFWGTMRFLITTLLFFTLLIVASYNIIGYMIRGEEIVAPDIKGKTVTEALEYIKKWNLSVVLDHSEPSETSQEGEIIRQDPTAGERIKTRTPIRVVISSGQSSVTLPADMVNISTREAGLRLRELDLKAGNVAYVPASGKADGTVLATDPPPGSSVPPRSGINMLVASESPGNQVIIPDMVGLTLEQAKGELARLGLNLAGSREMFTENGRGGLVHTQVPTAGIPVSMGTGVEVILQPMTEGDPDPMMDDNFDAESGEAHTSDDF